MKFSKIYIVGGAGVMGKLLLSRINLFYRSGEVVVFDKGDFLRIYDGTRDEPNLVIVATPISEIGKTLDKIAKINPKWTFVTEIGSVKGGLWADYFATMSQGVNRNLHFASTHPMVGPLAKDWDVLDWGKKCIIIDGEHDNTECHPWIVAFWRDLGFVIERLASASRHDEIVGKLSHLSHYMIKMYVKYINETMTPDEIRLGGTSFETFKKMAEGAERLNDIYEANKELPRLVEGFANFMKRVS